MSKDGEDLEALRDKHGAVRRAALGAIKALREAGRDEDADRLRDAVREEGAWLTEMGGPATVEDPADEAWKDLEQRAEAVRDARRY